MVVCVCRERVGLGVVFKARRGHPKVIKSRSEATSFIRETKVAAGAAAVAWPAALIYQQKQPRTSCKNLPLSRFIYFFFFSFLVTSCGACFGFCNGPPSCLGFRHFAHGNFLLLHNPYYYMFFFHWRPFNYFCLPYNILCCCCCCCCRFCRRRRRTRLRLLCCVFFFLAVTTVIQKVVFDGSRYIRYVRAFSFAPAGGQTECILSSYSWFHFYLYAAAAAAVGCMAVAETTICRRRLLLP